MSTCTVLLGSLVCWRMIAMMWTGCGVSVSGLFVPRGRADTRVGCSLQRSDNFTSPQVC